MGVAAAVGIGLGVASTGTKVYGLYKQNKAANKARDYNAEVAMRNAGYAEEQAGYLDEQYDYLLEQAEYVEGQAKEAIINGKREESAFRRNLRVFEGEQRARLGGSGIVVDAGSARRVALDTLRFGEQDAMTIVYNAEKESEALFNKAKGVEREALGTQREAKRYRDMAEDYRTNAAMLSAGKTSFVLPAIGATLSGASNIAGKYGDKIF